MSKKTRKPIPAVAKQPGIVINDFTQVAPDRSRKDIKALRQAIEAAETPIMPNRADLYDLYHDNITIDGHLSGILNKRRDTVRNKALQFVNAEGRVVDEMTALIDSAEFYRLCGLIIDSVFWGISGVQFIAGDKFDFVEIPRKHILAERGEICRNIYDCHGVPIADIPGAWLIGQPHDLGRLLTCMLYAIYKRGGLGDLAQYVEIFGQPVRIIHYDAYDTKTRDELRKMAQQAGSSLVMMIPKQAQFEMLDGKSSNGNGQLQRTFINTCNEEMSIAILGNSETTTSSASSGYAQAKEHGKQQQEIIKADMKLLLNTLNSDYFLGILALYGYPVEGGHFSFAQEVDLTALTQRINIDIQLADRVPIDDDYWYNTYGIPKPDNYDELKAQLEEQKQATLEALRRSSGASNDHSEDETQQEQQEKAQQRKENNRTRNAANKAKNLADMLQGFFGIAPHDGA